MNEPATMKTTKPEWTIHPRFSDIRPLGFVEALCSHGVGHHRGIHGCDGCCENMPEEIAKKTTKD